MIFVGSAERQIIQLVTDLMNLPEEAIAPPNTLTTNYSASLMAMNHAAWVPIRQKATRLLMLLEPEIQKNKAYFESNSES